MLAILTLVFTLAIGLIVTRVAATSLMLTGLSKEVARFQARSAFSGVGFTTAESESVINHPVRRKIIGSLMLLGNLGVAAVIASSISTMAFSPTNGLGWTYRALVLVGGLGTIWGMARSQILDQALSRGIEWALLRWTNLDVRDYVSLLHLSDGYVVLEMQVNRGDWIVDKSLRDSRLSLEGVLVLGIQRANGVYIGSPDGNTFIRRGDLLSIYGPIDRLQELDLRKSGSAGDQAHRRAIESHQTMRTETLQREQEKASRIEAATVVLEDRERRKAS